MKPEIETTDKPEIRKRSTGLKIIRIFAKVVLYTVLLFLVLILSLHIPFVQRFARGKVVSYLENKLDTKVQIGSVYIDFPKQLVLRDVYMEDRAKDTLISGGYVRADINLWRLVTKQDLNFQGVGLENITAKIKRSLPDTTFNYQFIVDAFVPPDTSSVFDSTASNAIHFGAVKMDKVRLIYNDVVTGTDLTAWVDHLDSEVDLFDGIKMNFDVPNTNVKGMVATINQLKPLASPEPYIMDSLDAAEPIYATVKFKKANLQDVHVVYHDVVERLTARFDVGLLEVEPEDIDLLRKRILLKDVEINNTTMAIDFGVTERAAVVKQQAKQQAKSLLDVGWLIRINSLALEKNNIRFDDANMRRTPGMDYGHLDAKDLSLETKDLLINDDTASGNVLSGSFREKSGFTLEQLKGKFVYTAKQAAIEGLYLKTPGTELKDRIAISYYSPEALVNDIGNMGIDLELNDSKLLVRDLTTLIPQMRTVPAFTNPATTWYIDSRITGRIADLRIERLKLQGLADTRIDVSGRVTGLPDANALQANLNIRNLASSRRDLNLFLPAGTIPSNITVPDRFNTNGQLRSANGLVNADLRINTTLGNASVKGSFRRIADAVNANYNVAVSTSNLNLGRIIQNPELSGPVSATFTASGTGYDPKTAVAKIDGTIRSAVIHQYNYRNVDVHAALAAQQARFTTTVHDPNIDMHLEGTADLSGAAPSLVVNGMIDSMKLQQLHIMPDNMIVRGKIYADFPVLNPDDLQGRLLMTQALFVQDRQRLNLDTVELTASRTDSIRSLVLKSDVAYAELRGQYKLTQLSSILQQAVQPYFAVAPAGAFNNAAPYNFTLNASVTDNPALKVFVPGLKRMDSVYIQSHFTNASRNAAINAAYIDINGSQVTGLHIDAGTGVSALNLKGTLAHLSSGSNIELNNTTITAAIANNKIDFSLNSKDNRNRDKYHIEGLFQQPQSNRYEFSISNDSLMLNYQPWTVTPNNQLIISKTGIHASNFMLSQGAQQLTITSVTAAMNAPIRLEFANFQLATLTGFVQTDSTLATGTMNGDVLVNDISKPLFTSDLIVSNFALRGDTVGDVHAIISNRDANTYTTNISLSGRGNDAKLTGNYYVNGNNNFDFALAVNTLPMATMQAFSRGKLRGATGSVNGNFTVKGNTSQPLINGVLKFNKAGFNFSMLNSFFSIDNEQLVINEKGIRFDQFEIRDSANNPLTINGMAATRNFMNYDFDLDVRADNFRALNSTKKDNRLFYGQLYFNTNLKVRGTEAAPAIDGRLVINEKTKMTVVIPQTEPGVVERDGIIEFVDMDAPLNDSLFLASYDSLNISKFTGMDIAVNIEIVPEAEFNLVIDEGNGDFLNVKGEAALTAGIDPSGKINLTGTYELQQGSYELTFNFLKRKFDIEKGSRITWNGEPTDATLDVRAVYVANASPLDLVSNLLGGSTSALQRNTYLQKLPFDVHLDMKGDLMKPDINFDIVLPTTKSYAVSGDILTNVRTRLDQLRQEEGEMNKQVFSLLLLNRFIGDNPFNSSEGGLVPDVGSLARQSVSKLLTEQLNRLAGDLIAGVDLNFDVTSTADYTTGQRKDLTNLNVGLSKQLLNDRLTVTVGSNFELEGPQGAKRQTSNIAGNVALDYRLSKDNRYLLRAYRKNEYQGIIEGYVIETGVGFIINVDYNRFREIFLSRKDREQRRLRREKQREIDKQQAADSTSAKPPTPVN